MNILVGILNTLLILSSFFLICLILIQRGKGGGLAGAFGGMGGSSAFGTKAGDVFTKVTMSVAIFWIVLCMLMVIISNRGGDSAWGTDSSGTTKVTKDSASGTRAKSKAATAAPDKSAAPAGPTGSSSSPAPIEVPAVPAPIPPSSKK